MHVLDSAVSAVGAPSTRASAAALAHPRQHPGRRKEQKHFPLLITLLCTLFVSAHTQIKYVFGKKRTGGEGENVKTDSLGRKTNREFARN